MLPRKIQELWDGMEKNREITLGAEFPHVLFGNLNLYEWPCIIVLGHERQHHPQIEAIIRKIKG